MGCRRRLTPPQGMARFLGARLARSIGAHGVFGRGEKADEFHR